MLSLKMCERYIRLEETRTGGISCQVYVDNKDDEWEKNAC